MKGIVLAGGSGTRLFPLTYSISKQILPVYDKPLIFYPLSILMLSKIKDILIIVNKGQINQYKKLIPDGKNLGINISLYSSERTGRERKKPLPKKFLEEWNNEIQERGDLNPKREMN